MQAGRELDAKVAEALGLEVFESDGEYYVSVDDETSDLVEHYSTTWEGMGVLVEEAREQGIFLEYEHCKDGRYIGRAWKFCEDSDDWLSMPRIRAIKPPVGGTAPHAVSLVYLQSKGISV